MAIIIPEVFTGLVREQFATKSKMFKYSKDLGTISDFSEVGETISFPKYALIGEAEDMVVGQALTPEQLAQTVETAKIVQVGKAIEVYDYNDKTMLGNAINEASVQIGIVMARKFDNDVIANALTTPLKVTTTGGNVSDLSDALVKGMAFFGDSQDASEFECITVNSRDLNLWYSLPEFTSVNSTIMGANNGVIQDGVVGTWRGIRVVLFDNGTFDKSKSKTRTFIIKKGSLGHKFKRNMNTEENRDILKKKTTIATDSIYATKLLNDAGIVLIGENL